MKLVFKVLLFSCFSMSFKTWGCEWKSPYGFISLSGPVTYELEALGLARASQWKAKSTYHLLSDDRFKGKDLDGGIFLSPGTLTKYKDTLFFIDRSADLEKNLRAAKVASVIIVDTRGLDPFQVTKLVRQKLNPYLKNCKSQVDYLEMEENKLKELFSKTAFKFKRILFFLGELKQARRWPNLLMNQDGIALGFQRYGKVLSYPSELNYVTWSTKIVDEFKKDENVLMLGINGVKHEAAKENIYISPLNKQVVNAFYPNGLVPGRPQMEFMQHILYFLKFHKDFKK